MALDVKVKIDLKKAIGKLSFGYPLIIAVGENAIAYTECKSLDDVSAAGYVTETEKKESVYSDTYKAAQLIFEQDNAPSKIAVCTVTGAVKTGLPAILEKGWRQLIVVSKGASETDKDIADDIEQTKDKMYFATVSTEAGLDGLGTGDRTVGFVHSNVLAAAALVGETAGRDVGSFTYKNLILKGIDPMTFTDTEIDKIHAKHGFTFVTKAGDNVTTEGTVMSGEYIDIIDSEDYVISQLEYKTQKLMNTTPKIPYDNTGIAMLESVALDVMVDAYNKGIIATDSTGKPAYAVSYDLVEEVETADKAARKYFGGKFNFMLAGAIHTCEITGTVEV